MDEQDRQNVGNYLASKSEVMAADSSPWPNEVIFSLAYHPNRYYIQGCWYDRSRGDYLYRIDYTEHADCVAEYAQRMANDLQDMGIVVDSIQVGFEHEGYHLVTYPADDRMYVKSWPTIEQAMTGSLAIIAGCLQP